MHFTAALHGPRRPPVTGPPSVVARLWMQTETACATMPKTAREPTATVPGSGLATALVMPLEMAMDTVTALAVVIAMVWSLAAVTASAVIAPVLVAPSAMERALAAGLETVQVLAAVLALGLTMTRALAVGLVLVPATVLAALLTTLLARAHIMVGAAGASNTCGRGRRR